MKIIENHGSFLTLPQINSDEQPAFREIQYKF